VTPAQRVLQRIETLPRSRIDCDRCQPPEPREEKRKNLTCVEPVSWFSRKVTAREGHQPMTPGGLPWGSISRQYSLWRAEWRIPCTTRGPHPHSEYCLWHTTPVLYCTGAAQPTSHVGGGLC